MVDSWWKSGQTHLSAQCFVMNDHVMMLVVGTDKGNERSVGRLANQWTSLAS